MKLYISLVLTILAVLFCINTNIYAERIVTMAPAITETVFALGKGDKIVGNTSFCNFPEEAKKIPRIGGFMDTNLEVLISFKPDVIFLYPEAYNTIKILKDKAKLVILKHTTLNDVFDGITIIAKSLHVETKGKALIESMKQKLAAIRQKASMKGKKKIKTLLVISRNPDDLTNMYIIGAKDFLNDLLDAAGGVNAYSGSIEYPSISIESIVAMNPGLIIELSAFNEGIKDENVLVLWKKFPYISAVKNNNIKIIRDSKWIIPGPRVAEIAEEMYKGLHPQSY